MKRDYTDGVLQGVNFFVGNEVEKTPAHGKKTLFVVGIHPSDIILSLATNKQVEHIYFGANMSFQVQGTNDYDGWRAWEDMITPLLNKGWLCTLDVDVKHVEGLVEGTLIEYNNFIPQISVKIPYAKLLNYNTCIKIDDKDFKSTNPGIWVHQLHALMSRETFNDWSEYSKDEMLK